MCAFTVSGEESLPRLFSLGCLQRGMRCGQCSARLTNTTLNGCPTIFHIRLPRIRLKLGRKGVPFFRTAFASRSLARRFAAGLETSRYLQIKGMIVVSLDVCSEISRPDGPMREKPNMKAKVNSEHSLALVFPLSELVLPFAVDTCSLSGFQRMSITFAFLHDHRVWPLRFQKPESFLNSHSLLYFSE